MNAAQAVAKIHKNNDIKISSEGLTTLKYSSGKESYDVRYWAKVTKGKKMFLTF